jgi:hypothetical protein
MIITYGTIATGGLAMTAIGVSTHHHEWLDHHEEHEQKGG